MIVVITSCAPTVALRKPAIPAHAAPASTRAVIASRTCGTWPCRRTRADPDGNDRPDDVLALSADVEEAAAERERDREPGEDERRGHQERLREVVRRGWFVFVSHQNQTWSS